MNNKIINHIKNLTTIQQFNHDMLNLNNIYTLLTNAKGTNLDAINNSDSYFSLTDDIIQKIITDNDNEQFEIIKTPNVSNIFSFRIIPIEYFTNTNYSNSALINSYLVSDLNKYKVPVPALLIAFANDTLLDIYVSKILEIISDSHDLRIQSNYYTFIKNDAIQIKSPVIYSLAIYLTYNDISVKFFNLLIQQLISDIIQLKNSTYGFIHGNYTTHNILYDQLRNHWVMSNFTKSSIFYNGIRFTNVHQKDKFNTYSTVSNTYKYSMDTCAPNYESVDIYTIALDLATHYKIAKLFIENNNQYIKKFYTLLFSQKECGTIWLLMKNIIESYDQIKNKIYDVNDLNPNMITSFISDLELLNYEKFKNKYNTDPEYISIYRGEYGWTGWYSTEIYNLVDQYYSTISKLSITNFNLKINIDEWYLQFVGKLASNEFDNSVLPYRKHSDRYFQLTNSKSGAYHICLSRCIDNTCDTNKWSYSTALGTSYYTKDTCTVEFNVFEMSQYKIISIMLDWYNADGTLDVQKLNKDDKWRILLAMLIDNNLVKFGRKASSPEMSTTTNSSFDCSNDFILNGNLLPHESLSRSRQFVDIDLSNPVQKLNLTFNDELVDKFISNISSTTNDVYMLKPSIINLITDCLSKININAYAKINAISTSKTDIYNKSILNEEAIYHYTNSLVLNCNTPHVCIMFVNSECNASTSPIYNNYILPDYVDSNNNHISMGDYFQYMINGPVLSYKIFITELLKSSMTLYNFLLNNINNFSDQNLTNDWYCILIQIAYTLGCFDRIGIIHNDLHPGNIFIETLNNPVNLVYVISMGKNINKIIKIHTIYFVRIFDFDRSYTISSRPSNVIDIKPIESVDPLINKFYHNKYDWFYLQKFLYETISDYDTNTPLNKLSFNSINSIFSKFMGQDYMNYIAPNKIKLDKNSEPETSYASVSTSPYDWLLNLKSMDNIYISNDFNGLDINPDTRIYLSPGINGESTNTYVDKIILMIEKNPNWNNFTVQEKINVCSLLVKNFESNEILDKLQNICKKNMGNLYIDWIRHAESCSNFDSGNYVDKNTRPKRPLGYNTFDQDMPDDPNVPIYTKSLDSKLKASWRYEPNLSYIGMQQAIMLGVDFISKQKYTVVLCSPLTRTIMTAILAFRSQPNIIINVVPYISELQNVFKFIGSDYQNTAVSSTILKRRIKFIKDWLENNWIDKFDDIEIMGDLLRLRQEISDDNMIRQITQVIKCKDTSFNPSDRFTNKYQQCEKSVPNLINSLLDWFNRQSINNWFTDKYTGIDFVSFKRGPKVNFSILEKYEKIYKEKMESGDPDAAEYNTKNHNLLKFYSDIIPSVIDISQNNKICVFSHGSLIRYIWSTKSPNSYFPIESKLKHMKNVTVIQENFTYDNSDFKQLNDPIAIRSSYENFEDLNVDVCRSQSIKGVLNFNLPEPYESIVGSTASWLKSYIISDKLTEPYLSYDTKFYSDNNYNIINDSIIE